MPTRNLDWQQQAACRDLDTDIFFPVNEEGAQEAISICRICPVREECLEWALETRQHDGVWGGTTEADRKRIRRRRAAAARAVQAA